MITSKPYLGISLFQNYHFSQVMTPNCLDTNRGLFKPTTIRFPGPLLRDMMLVKLGQRWKTDDPPA